MYSNWYILHVLCWLAAGRVVMELSSGPTLLPASRRNTHKNIPAAVYTVPPDDEQISARNM
jgi:hypothetical protein